MPRIQGLLGTHGSRGGRSRHFETDMLPRESFAYARHLFVLPTLLELIIRTIEPFVRDFTLGWIA